MNILRLMIPKSSVEYISADATVRQAYEKMRYHSYVAIPVLDDEGIWSYIACPIELEYDEMTPGRPLWR